MNGTLTITCSSLHPCHQLVEVRWHRKLTRQPNSLAHGPRKNAGQRYPSHFVPKHEKVTQTRTARTGYSVVLRARGCGAATTLQASAAPARRVGLRCSSALPRPRTQTRARATAPPRARARVGARVAPRDTCSRRVRRPSRQYLPAGQKSPVACPRPIKT
jgi:hypothetical protein